MLDRQRVLLELLRRAPQPVGSTKLMKWLFLLREETDLARRVTFYDFVPYKYGPFSFTAYREIDSLRQLGYIGPGDFSIPKAATGNVASETRKLPRQVLDALDEVLGRYGRLDLERLLTSVYDRYSWFASRSELRPPKAKPRPAPVAVYTVGYEGVSLDSFLSTLLRAGIRRLVDVRRNPLSRKYGFSGSSLRRLCADVDISYVPLPALGIPSELRRDLSTPESYTTLFNDYEATTLSAELPTVRRLASELSEAPSAIMCFESDSKFCHRGRLAPQLALLSGLSVRHL